MQGRIVKNGSTIYKQRSIRRRKRIAKLCGSLFLYMKKREQEFMIFAGFLRKRKKRGIVNLVQKKKMKISTIAESEKNDENRLHCGVQRVKILT